MVYIKFVIRISMKSLDPHVFDLRFHKDSQGSTILAVAIQFGNTWHTSLINSFPAKSRSSEPVLMLGLEACTDDCPTISKPLLPTGYFQLLTMQNLMRL